MLMTPLNLALTLRGIADRIERGDSYEGYIEYRVPNAPTDDLLEVSGSYRYGNAEHGQGFVRVIKEGEAQSGDHAACVYPPGARCHGADRCQFPSRCGGGR